MKEIDIPNSVKTIEREAFEEATSLTVISFPENLESIKESAFKGCTSLKEISIPDSVKKIENEAYSNCTSLEKVKLSNTIQTINSAAFRWCTSLKQIKIPASLEETAMAYDYTGPFSGSGLESVEFEKGTTKITQRILKGCKKVKTINIPSSVTVIEQEAFNGCEALKEIYLPESVRKIGDEAFYGCTSLQYTTLGNNIEDWGGGVFSKCDLLVLSLNYLTNNVIYAIDNECEFVASGEKFVDNSNMVINRKDSLYNLNSNIVTTNSCLPFVIKYNCKDKWIGELSDRKIVTYIPKYTNLKEDSIKINGATAKQYSYDENTRKLTIPIELNSASITYSVFVRSKEKIKSYAYLSAKKEGKRITETIGAINEDFTGITISASDNTKTKEISVSGITTPSTNVTLYVDGEAQDTVKSLKNGAYSGIVKLKNPKDKCSYYIEAKGVDEYENEIIATKEIMYEDKAPELQSLKVEYNEHNNIKSVELVNNSKDKPVIYYLPNSAFTFKAKFDDISNIENVYITSTRNNEKKSIEAKYDSKSQSYIAEGYFDPQNTNYVPGEIGVEYNKKNSEIVPSNKFDVVQFKNVVGDDLDNVKITEFKESDNELSATIDASGAFKDGLKGIIKADFKAFDKEFDTSISDIYKMAGLTDKAFSYLLPGQDGKKYIFNLEWTDSDNVVMVAYDTTDVGLTIAEKIVTAKLDMKDFGSDSYDKLFDANTFLGYASKGSKFAYETYGIYKDYYKLLDEINKSDTIENKVEARNKAEELRQNQMAFLAVTTLLPVMLAASTMTGPVLIASCLLAAMSATSGIFFDLRVAQIKGQSFKLNWIVDPSGYIYDVNTNLRIEGAKVSAYWIPYDESEDFWEKKPGMNNYGVLWNSEEYEQQNPLISNVDGKYAWDVPEGWWRVKVEKEGYVTQWSDWMTVPPIQMDVNIGLVPIGDNITTTTSKPTEKRTQKIVKNENPKTITKLTAKNVKKKRISLKWQKVAKVKGYQIQYAFDRKFKKSRKTKNTSKTSYTIKKLKKKKTYYIRVRAYAVINGKKMYGNWSKTKKIKVKR